MKKIHIIISLVSILFLANCGGEDKTEDENSLTDSSKITTLDTGKVTDTVIPEKEHEDNSKVLKDKFYKHFSGQLNGSSQIEMDLTCTGGNKLIGSYFNKKTGKTQVLHGTVDENGKFTLKEISGKQGEFEGEYSVGRFSGKWKSGKTSEEFNFELAEDYSTSEKLSYAEVSEKYKGKGGEATDFRSFYYFKNTDEVGKLISLAHFPKAEKPVDIEGFVKNFSSDFIKDFKGFDANDGGMGWDLSMTADVLYNYNNFISYGVHTSSFEGGAHGSYASEYTVIDTKTKAKLFLSDIINAGSEAKLAKIVYDNIKVARDFNDADMQDTYFSLPLPMPSNFYISAEGLYFSYGQYEIAPYAAGPDEVLLKYSEIKEFISEKYLSRLML